MDLFSIVSVVQAWAVGSSRHGGSKYPYRHRKRSTPELVGDQVASRVAHFVWPL